MSCHALTCYKLGYIARVHNQARANFIGPSVLHDSSIQFSKRFFIIMPISSQLPSPEKECYQLLVNYEAEEDLGTYLVGSETSGDDESECNCGHVKVEFIT